MIVISHCFRLLNIIKLVRQVTMKSTKLKRIVYITVASMLATTVSGCSDIMDFFDRVGSHMPTYDGVFCSDSSSESDRHSPNGQPTVVKHAQPADAAQPQYPDVDKYMQQQRQGL